jgi:anti-sigma regulatory factor (Ser/Thr protein kinase)
VDEVAVSHAVREAVEGAGSTAIEDRRALGRLSPDLAESMQPAPGSLYAAAFVVDGRTVGAAAVLFAGEHVLADDDRAVIQAHADQASEALGRIGRHQLEHDTAIVLQRSLLPGALTGADGVEVTAHYRAGGPGVEVGGDWYDVVRRPDGVVHLMIGDVAGRGIPAAVLMGQLRTALSAYALDSTSPAELVDRVGRHVMADSMATMVCVTFDPLTRELSYASAGHPPPLLVDAETHAVSFLDRRGRPPLGWNTRKPLLDSAHEVPEQATLVLYTDGLVERRDLEIDRGIELLVGAVGAQSAGSFAEAATRVVDSIAEPGAVEDDAALLLVRLAPVPARISIEFRARASLLQELRRRLRAWTRLRGFDPDQQQAAILAISEACNNAIEHGYRDSEGVVRLELDHVGDSLSIVVEDDGLWREPRLDPTRGRGLVIMKELMTATEVTQKPRGTRVALEQSLV